MFFVYFFLFHRHNNIHKLLLEFTTHWEMTLGATQMVTILSSGPMWWREKVLQRFGLGTHFCVTWSRSLLGSARADLSLLPISPRGAHFPSDYCLCFFSVVKKFPWQKPLKGEGAHLAHISSLQFLVAAKSRQHRNLKLPFTLCRFMHAWLRSAYSLSPFHFIQPVVQTMT